MITVQKIQTKIYHLRGLKVMLDFDLAKLYQTETKRLKEAVRRNQNRFPADFMFILTKVELKSLRTQIASSKRGGIRYLPLAFTEQGVAMLASVLSSAKAIEVNIQIVRTFVLIREYALSHKELTSRLKKLEAKYDIQFKDVYDAIAYLLAKESEKTKVSRRKRIGYDYKNKE